jgi:hypothetical protein
LTDRRLAAAGDQDGALASLPPDARSRVRRVLASALAADPEDRFESAAALVDALASSGSGVQVPEAARVSRSPARLQQESPAGDGDSRPAPALTPPVDVGQRELARVPRVEATAPLRAQVVPPTATHERSTPYPWSAIAAVAIASLLLGSVLGYAVGRRSAPSPVQTISTGQADTEVPVTPDPPIGAPPRAPARDAQPAVNVTPPAPGRVVVRSVPAGALVTVDGRRAGETPVTVTDLSLGAHTLLIARPGYVPRTEQVTITSGAPSRSLTVELRPGLDVAAAQLGSIYVDTRPRGARVTVDGRLVGTTPVRVPELARGEHRVLVELDGFRAHSTVVTVQPGAQARLAVTLVREERE